MKSKGNFRAGGQNGNSEDVDHSGVGLLKQTIVNRKSTKFFGMQILLTHPVVAKLTQSFVINLVTSLSCFDGMAVNNAGIVL